MKVMKMKKRWLRTELWIAPEKQEEEEGQLAKETQGEQPLR